MNRMDENGEGKHWNGKHIKGKTAKIVRQQIKKDSKERKTVMKERQ